MSLLNPCIPGNAVKNTGVECSTAMLATYMIIMMPKAAKWTESDEADFTGYAKTQIHAIPSLRWYPLFGQYAKVNQITDSNESDVTETMEDGSIAFIRNGMYNRTFLSTKGGDCFAKALQSIPHDYSFVVIDIEGKLKRMINSDTTRSGFPVNTAFAPTPEEANLKTTFKNKFTLSYSPSDFITKGSIAKGDSTEDVLSLAGLLDTKVVDSPGILNSTTKIYVDVKTICAETDLIALYGATLAVAGNFIVKNAGGTVLTPSGVAVVGGRIEFTGTFPTGTNCSVALAAASVLKAAGIVGYEGIVTATCPIP